ncbi:GntR family transcriptional regulator [Bacillus sp. FJAT-27245]|uniref:FadR/GntR family transcriptional regulator n=1 Tax=Bacillus sp. FJAT-27245 TaxID=1684144 RepID=UPI0006A77EE7
MIAADGLKTGDKIPSERELSERLNVGRSSVREALRALELLGLIETRRGEGTFIRDFQGNSLVQLLSTFILQDEKARRDVKETKYFIEMDCLRLILQKKFRPSLEEIYSMAVSVEIDDDEFFHRLILLADNHLFLRIWVILKDYYHSQGFKKERARPEEYRALLDALSAGKEGLAIEKYMELRKMSKS